MTHSLSRLLPMAVSGWTVIGLLLVTNPSHAQPEAVMLAQSPVPAASIFSEWSADDVRQGASPKAAERPRLTTTPTAPSREQPREIRGGSTPGGNTSYVMRWPWQAAPGAVSTPATPLNAQQPESASTPTTKTPAHEPFITLRPFSDGDLRQGSARR